ncbi:radial spoke protein [Thraustotheca clavata]|uniref:Radial spoke head protein 9 homolog n=1 Tax=Thraustotheca clavata TaxID=74557 RepID=A0A1W0AC41_9STRA|nr:radial spoke protein [Thraustotheca clavata]
MELDHIDIVSRSIGSTLTSQERSNLEVGFVKRYATENITTMRFWGRISGEMQDYIICAAFIQAPDVPKKKFYFCTNTSPELQQFPEVGVEKRNKATKYTSRLKGDPSKPMDENDASQDDSNKDIFREVDRLVILVEAIDYAASIVPCGAFVVSATHQIVPNPMFNGLAWDRALQLSSYYHFREAESTEPKGSLALPGLIRPTDFLDPITMDLDGVWNLRKDNTGSAVILRNMLYPGSIFFHKPKTNQYGFAYFGDGLKNPDLAFML